MKSANTFTEAGLSDSSLYRLMTWLSPAYPVGAYSYSHSLEYAVEDGQVNDLESFETWARGILRFGAAHCDAVLFCHGWAAVTEGDRERFVEIVELAAALRGTAELALESIGPGEAFLATVENTLPSLDISAWRETLSTTDAAISYPVAVAIPTALGCIAKAPALTAFLHAFTANLVSAAIRLVPLGQTDGQLVLAKLESSVLETLAVAVVTDIEELGTAALMVDWASMQHETQYTRLFRS